MLLLSSCATKKTLSSQTHIEQQVTEQVKQTTEQETESKTVVSSSDRVDESTLEEESTTVIVRHYSYTEDGEQRLAKEEITTKEKNKQSTKEQKQATSIDEVASEKTLENINRETTSESSEDAATEQQSEVKQYDWSWLWKTALCVALLIVALSVYKYRK